MTPLEPSILAFCRSAALGGTLLMLIACGDESSAGDAVVIDSGLSPDKLLLSLSDQEALQLCDATGDAVSEIYSHELQVDAACTVAGVSLSIVQGADGRLQLDRVACERAHSECVMNARRSTPVETRMCELHPMRMSSGAACSATVAEYERCMSATLHAAADLIAGWDCAYFATQPLNALPSASMALPAAPIDVPECADFEAKCGALPPL